MDRSLSPAKGAPAAGGGRPWLALAGLLMVALLFAALGNWQVHRLAWKQALVARVARATTAPPLALSALPTGPVAPLEYRRVVVAGRYVPASTTLVTTTSDLGSGYWVMTALRGPATAVWVNRGFVPLGSLRAGVMATTPTGPVTVTGLVRPDQPGGTWLRANLPAADRWYSRDLAAMAGARHLPGIPSRIFVDAQDESPHAAIGAPVAGLTILTFPNNHLSYALTWFAMALVSVGGAVVLWRRSS